MRITQESDYALRIITALAKNGEVMDAKELSDLTSVSQTFTLKILHKLVKGKLVSSFKGVKGGYKIAKSPSSITMKDVIELIEGSISFCRCLGNDQVCSQNDKTECLYHRIFSGISQHVADTLGNITINLVVDGGEELESLLSKLSL